MIENSKGWYIAIAMLICCLAAGQSYAGAFANAPALKFRVSMETSEPAKMVVETVGSGSQDETVRSKAYKVNKKKQIQALEAVKRRVVQSDFMRLVDAPAGDKGPAGSNIDYSLKTWCEESTLDRSGKTHSRFTIHIIVESPDGLGGLNAGAEADTPEDAAANIVNQVGNWLAMRTWRCRVWDSAQGFVLINRGADDGFSEGMILNGIRMNAEFKQINPSPDLELAIAKYGQASGQYRIVDVGESVSKLKPANGAPMLSKGDILELPGARKKKWNQKTRASGAWDEIYK
ncbi:hypothetical protein Dalk_3233 [Desulfatibacillum aliphaticivorans]|uniref:Uncharacterized protein n=1 Tax=Desulfatibacillum aliphaticivorans TaxID=218208 RepID=B8FGL4_DESAL|nr:hypothetical protein [Desulfatibacillum aliphaticivorans]ACL04923.1 hypothetical protein Dalk_3233 [Desulfatibacillum aliphaticivorans]